DNAGLDLNATDDGGEHGVTRRTALGQQVFSIAGDPTKIRLVRNYAMLDYLCKSRTHFVKWKRIKDLRIYNYCDGRVKNAHQILPGRGIHGCFPPDRGVDHRHQTGRDLSHRNAAHEGSRHESVDVANDSSAD